MPADIYLPSSPSSRLKSCMIRRRDWRDIIYELHKVEISPDGNRSIITFPKDMQYWEVTHYQSSLPQTVKSKRKGSTLIIENPKEFTKWLGRPQSRSWLSKLLKGR